MNDQVQEQIDQLTKAVSENTDVVSSATQAIDGLAHLVASAGQYPNLTQVQALAEQIRKNNDALRAAIVANTPHEATQPPPAAT